VLCFDDFNIASKKKDDKGVIETESIQDLFPWIDAAFAVRMNMRSHTNGAMSFGRGMMV